MQARSGPYLRTLGATALIGAPQPASVSLRAKDLALLVYLCVNERSKHTRSALATLLWGDRDEARARHSLTQALRRLRLTLGGDAFVLGDRMVEWEGQLACDALELERAVIDPGLAEPGLPFYGGDFLSDLDAGRGAAAFSSWADGRRAHFRYSAARALGAQGRAAEALGQWDVAMQLSHRLIGIEPMSQQAHRRVMRAWCALGEQALAVRHYQRFERWLREECGELPDPATRALFEELRSGGTPTDSRGAAWDASRPPGVEGGNRSGDRRARFPLPAADDVQRATSEPAPALAAAPAPAPDVQRARDAPGPGSAPTTPVTTTQSPRARRGFVFAATIVALITVLGVAVIVATLEP